MARHGSNTRSRLASAFVAALGITGRVSGQLEAGPQDGMLVNGYCFYFDWEYASRWTLSMNPAQAGPLDGKTVAGAADMTAEELMQACTEICNATPPCTGASLQYHADGDRSDSKRVCYLKTWDEQGTARPCLNLKPSLDEGGKLDIYAMIQSEDGSTCDFTWRPKGDFMECPDEQEFTQYGDAWQDGPEVPAAAPTADGPAPVPSAEEPVAAAPAPGPAVPEETCQRIAVGDSHFNVYTDREYLDDARNAVMIANVEGSDGISLTATDRSAMVEECAQACYNEPNCTVAAVYYAAPVTDNKQCWLKYFVDGSGASAECVIPEDIEDESNYMAGAAVLIEYPDECPDEADISSCQGQASGPLAVPASPPGGSGLSDGTTPEAGSGAAVMSASMALMAAGVFALYLA